MYLIDADLKDSGPWFSLDVEPAREEVRLQAIGELDLAAAPALHQRVDELIAAGFRQLVIDLRRVTFIDLTGVRLLLKLAQEASEDGWRLSLTQPGRQVGQLLTLTGVLGRLPMQSPTAGTCDEPSSSANPSAGSIALGSVC